MTSGIILSDITSSEVVRSAILQPACLDLNLSPTIYHLSKLGLATFC